jgi:hypothetical protein
MGVRRYLLHGQRHRFRSTGLAKQKTVADVNRDSPAQIG